MGNFTSTADTSREDAVDTSRIPSEDQLHCALTYFFDVPLRKQTEFKKLLSKLNFEIVRQFFPGGAQIVREGDTICGLFVSVSLYSVSYVLVFSSKKVLMLCFNIDR